MTQDKRAQFLALLAAAVAQGSLVKLTLGKPVLEDDDLRNLFIRPVQLKAGGRLAFVWRHATRDITKNLEPSQALEAVAGLLGPRFADAHLFTRTGTAQLELGGSGPRLVTSSRGRAEELPEGNDRQKRHVISPKAPWLEALEVTDAAGRPRPGKADKLRQIEKFAEILLHLANESGLDGKPGLEVFDMGCGKGYLTFAATEVLGQRARVCGVEARPDLVEFCSKTADRLGWGGRLSFRHGTIADTDVGKADILIALHACDTATDDALARGLKAGASLLVVAPCCQKELRPQIVAPGVLANVLRHGIFLERQAEFVTDALRAQLLEFCGYRTKVFEFISTEHTAKNTMIAAVRHGLRGDESAAERIRAFARFYGIRSQSLASQIDFSLA